MRTLLILLLAILLTACASETEQKSLDKIAEIYDATTSYSKGFSSSVGQETIRKFTAKVSESKLIDSLNPNVTSSNIALLVFDGFNEDEKSKYKSIDVQLINKNGDTMNYSYPSDILNKLHAKSKVFYQFSNGLLENDALKIDELRNEKQIPQPVGTRILANLSNYSNSYGSLVAYQPFGIAEASDDLGGVYQFQANLVFSSGKRIPYMVVVDTSPERDKLEGFKFFK
jgi:hypothetical protein